MSHGSSAPAHDGASPVRALLSAMSDRTRAMLEYHFEHDPHRAFALARSVDVADVVVVDYDYPGARASLEGGRWRDGPPLLVLAHDAPDIDDALVLGKPLDRSRLDEAAARLRDSGAGSRPSGRIGTPSRGAALSELRDKVASNAASVGGGVDPAPAVPPSRPTSTPSTESPSKPPDPSSGSLSEPPLIELAPVRRRAPPADPSAVAVVPRDDRGRVRAAALCGPARSLAELALADDPVHRYDPARHLIGHLGDALDALQASGPAARGLMLRFPDIELYVLPWLGRICTSEPLTWMTGVDRAFRRLEAADVERVAYDARTVNTLVARVNERACQAFPVPAFRWLAALFSARGRLPFGVDVEQPLRLERWPNLSRLEMTPDCMPIVAEWTARPHSIAGMIEHLGCEPCHVTALYAATTASGLLHPIPPTDDGEDDGA